MKRLANTKCLQEIRTKNIQNKKVCSEINDNRFSETIQTKPNQTKPNQTKLSQETSRRQEFFIRYRSNKPRRTVITIEKIDPELLNLEDILRQKKSRAGNRLLSKTQRPILTN